MTEIYRQWQENAQILIMLTRLGWEDLTPENQLILESCINRPGDQNSLDKAIKALRPPKGTAYRTLDLLRQTIEATDFKTIGTGANPYRENEQTDPNSTSD